MSITLLQTKLNILLCAEFLDLVVLVQDKKYHASVSILLPKKKRKQNKNQNTTKKPPKTKTKNHISLSAWKKAILHEDILKQYLFIRIYCWCYLS